MDEILQDEVDVSKILGQNLEFQYLDFNKFAQRIRNLLSTNVLSYTDDKYSEGPISELLAIESDQPNRVSTSICRELFEGIINTSQKETRIVLDSTSASPSIQKANISFDIDSLLGLPDSLNVAKRGFQVR